MLQTVLDTAEQFKANQIIGGILFLLFKGNDQAADKWIQFNLNRGYSIEMIITSFQSLKYPMYISLTSDFDINLKEVGRQNYRNSIYFDILDFELNR